MYQGEIYFSRTKPIDLSLDEPITINHEGIKLKPEIMIKEELYHCIFQNRVFLFYKDNDYIIHCYEVGDPNIITKIRENPNSISDIFNEIVKESDKNIKS